jgi:all-trans-retinol dehydrogenase (NAD+)
MTVSSAAGLVGAAQQTDCSAAKFAAFGFAGSLRAELAKDGSRVDSPVACPYCIDTGMLDGVRTKFPRMLPILRPESAAR